MAVKFPEIEVQLSEQDGNIFSIIARVQRAMRQSGGVAGEEDVDAFVEEVTSAKSYDEALQCVMRWVDVS